MAGGEGRDGALSLVQAGPEGRLHGRGGALRGRPARNDGDPRRPPGAHGGPGHRPAPSGDSPVRSEEEEEQAAARRARVLEGRRRRRSYHGRRPALGPRPAVRWSDARPQPDDAGSLRRPRLAVPGEPERVLRSVQPEPELHALATTMPGP